MLQQARLGCGMFRLQGFGHSSGEAFKRRFEERMPAHDPKFLLGHFLTATLASNEAKTSRPTPNIAESKYPNAGLLMNRGA